MELESLPMHTFEQVNIVEKAPLLRIIQELVHPYAIQRCELELCMGMVMKRVPSEHGFIITENELHPDMIEKMKQGTWWTARQRWMKSLFTNDLEVLYETAEDLCNGGSDVKP